MKKRGQPLDQMNEAMKGAAKPRPQWHRTLITRESKTRLTALLKEGLRVPATVGKALEVTFKQVGDIMTVPNTGWQTVRLRSNFGGTSTLLYEEHAGRVISGLLRLKR